MYLNRPSGYGERRKEFFYQFRDVAEKKNSHPRDNVTTVEEVHTLVLQFFSVSVFRSVLYSLANRGHWVSVQISIFLHSP